MAYFLFVGDPRYSGEGKGEISFMGYTFNRLTPSLVDENDSEGKIACAKLRGNNHFVEVVQDQPNEGDASGLEKRGRGRPSKSQEE